MRIPSLARLVASIALIALFPVEGRAQSCTGAGSYVVWVRPALIQFPAPSSADFDAGWLEAPVAEVRVTPRGAASQGWEVCLRAESATMGGYGKPISDIEFRQNGTGPWVPLSSSDQLLASGDRGASVQLQFRVALDWTEDVPGQYAADFTATAAKN